MNRSVHPFQLPGSEEQLKLPRGTSLFSFCGIDRANYDVTMSSPSPIPPLLPSTHTLHYTDPSKACQHLVPVHIVDLRHGYDSDLLAFIKICMSWGLASCGLVLHGHSGSTDR